MIPMFIASAVCLNTPLTLRKSAGQAVGSVSCTLSANNVFTDSQDALEEQANVLARPTPDILGTRSRMRCQGGAKIEVTNRILEAAT